jgi:hypothetical protein
MQSQRTGLRSGLVGVRGARIRARRLSVNHSGGIDQGKASKKPNRSAHNAYQCRAGKRRMDKLCPLNRGSI